MKPDIRFFCLTLPGTAAPQLGFDYVQALLSAQHRVRIMAIGTTWFDEPPWCDVAEHFTTELQSDFVNMVCVPPNFPLGASIKVEDVIAPENLPGYIHPEGESSMSPNEVIYDPPTALGGLYTVGVKNIACTRPVPTPTDREIQNLKQYDEIWVPFEMDAEIFTELGLSVSRKGPSDL